MAIIKIGNPAIDLDAAEIPNLDTAKITTGQFTDSRIADVAATKITGTITPSDSTVTLAKLTATGTKDATTFLRGDNTFAEAGGGKLLQVVHANTSTQVSNSSNTLADTTLTASITPSATSSKILVLITHNGNYKSSETNNSIRLMLYRDSTNIGRTGGINFSGSATETISGSANFNVVDSPSSTSALTYKTQFANINGGASVAVQKTFGGSWDSTSYITLMEIAG